MAWFGLPGREPVATMCSVGSCAPWVSEPLLISQFGTFGPRVLVSEAAMNCTETVSPALKKPRLAMLVTKVFAQSAEVSVNAGWPCRSDALVPNTELL